MITITQSFDFQQMQKLHKDSESEIRRLKTELQSMNRESQVCASIFLNADYSYKRKFLDRNKCIIYLQNFDGNTFLNF